MNNIYYKKYKNWKKREWKMLQVRGSGKLTSFLSNSKLSLAAWSEKKNMTFIDGEKEPFRHSLNFGLFRHFRSIQTSGQRLTCGFYTQPALSPSWWWILYIDNFRRETSILLVMSASKVVIWQSNHPQLPLLSSSESSLSTNEASRLAFIFARWALLA